jgi:alpha-1,3/alpha-1,6-mannosyltransferase
VKIYTCYHDPLRSFEETNDGTLEIIVRGNKLPRAINGYGHILCAIVKSFYLAFWVLYDSLFNPQDMLIVDQLSAPIPILKLTKSKILFYCHFPDKLLSTRKSLLKLLYRIPFDAYEELTTKMADAIVVNSKFTASTLLKSFWLIQDEPKVVYPGINLEKYKATIGSVKLFTNLKKRFALSVNRFEKKKNIELAIEAVHLCIDNGLDIMLVVAGGYDVRVSENVEYLKELQLLADRLGLKHKVWKKGLNIEADTSLLFLTTFDDEQRNFLLQNATCLIYTPENEHFGIVPLEAMYSGLPVIACNSGGPTETVLDGETGYLCSPNPLEFSRAIEKVYGGNFDSFGQNGKNRVTDCFSLMKFTDSLEEIIKETMKHDNLEALLAFYLFIAVLSYVPMYCLKFIIF